MHSILYLIRHPPGNLANETIDMVLVSGIFDQPTKVLFLDDGVYQLVGDGEIIDRKDTLKKWSALPTYGVGEIFAAKNSLDTRGISNTELPVFVSVVNEPEVADLLHSVDQVVND